MTREDLDAIEARFGATGKSLWPMGKILEYCDEAQAAFLSYVRTDVPALIAEVKRQNAEIERLTRERDAAVADLEPYQDWRGCDSCMFDEYCGYAPDKSKCADCDEFSNWEWRGVKETVNG